MSEQETHIGTIQLLPRLGGECDERYFERVTKKDFKAYGDEPDNMKEAIYTQNLEDHYMVCNNTLYKILEDKELSNSHFCKLEFIEDNKINFATTFYNGGTCLEEMIETELRKAKNGRCT